MSNLSLSQGPRENRLEDFIRQQETNGVGPVNKGNRFDYLAYSRRTQHWCREI